MLLFIGNTLFQFAELASTNTYLQNRLLQENLPEGTAVTADFQHNGRGQRGTNWQSAAGQNLLTSILLYPHFLKPDDQFILSMAIALGVHSFIRKNLPENTNVYIKWPNDIWVEKDKIAGILIENTIQSGTLRSSIIGIGININQVSEMLPGSTSLRLQTGQNFNIKHLLPMLYMEIEEKYIMLKNGFYRQLEAFYSEGLYGLGEKLPFRDNILEQDFEGTISGTTKNGALCIETQSGARIFGVKEIKFL